MPESEHKTEGEPHAGATHAGGGLAAKWRDMPTSQKWLIGLGALTLVFTVYLGIRSQKNQTGGGGGGSMPVDGSAGATDQFGLVPGGIGAGGAGAGGSTGGSASGGGIVGSLTGPTGIATFPGVGSDGGSPSLIAQLFSGTAITGRGGSGNPGTSPFNGLGPGGSGNPGTSPFNGLGPGGSGGPGTSPFNGLGPGGSGNPVAVDPWAQWRPGAGGNPGTSPFNGLGPGGSMGGPVSAPGGAGGAVDPWAQWRPGAGGSPVEVDPWAQWRPGHAAHVDETASSAHTVDHAHPSIGWNIQAPARSR